MRNLPRRIGFEIEFLRTKSDGTPVYLNDVSRYLRQSGVEAHMDESYRSSDGSCWDLKRDGSCGWEMASPAFSTYDDLIRETQAACSAIQQAGGMVDTRCGLHVHVEAGSRRELDDVKFLENLFRFLIRYQGMFMDLVPLWRRSNAFCHALPKVFSDDVKKAKTFGDFRQLDHAVNFSKNHWVNVLSLGRHNTLEFRIMVGTINAAFIIGYVAFLEQIVDTFMGGKKIEWGEAKSRSSRDLFQTALGQANFYGPWRDAEHEMLAKVGRAWATGQWKAVNGQIHAQSGHVVSLHQGDEYVSPKVVDFIRSANALLNVVAIKTKPVVQSQRLGVRRVLRRARSIVPNELVNFADTETNTETIGEHFTPTVTTEYVTETTQST